MFPGPGSITIEEMPEQLLKRSVCSLKQPGPKRLKVDDESKDTQGGDRQQSTCPLQRVVFIDSTWNQTNKIITDERLQGNYVLQKRLMVLLV